MEAAALGRNERVNPPLPSDTPLSSHGKWDGWGGGGFIVAIIRCLNGNELFLGTQGYNGIVDAAETPSEHCKSNAVCACGNRAFRKQVKSIIIVWPILFYEQISDR